MARKDRWNGLPPSADAEFLPFVQHPELAKLLPVLYPGVFPNLAGLFPYLGVPHDGFHTPAA